MGLAAVLVLVSGFESPCLLGLGSLCLDLTFGATCRRERDCQNQKLAETAVDSVWTAVDGCGRRVDPAHLVASAAVRSDAGAAALLCPLHLQVETSALSPTEAAGEGEASYRRVSSGDVQRLRIFVLLPPQSPHTVSRLGNAVRLLQHCNNKSQAVSHMRAFQDASERK